MDLLTSVHQQSYQPGEEPELLQDEASLRRFDLNILVGLQALLRYRNVSRAGDHIGLTQSAMSDELRRLRQLFCDQLLIRSGRGYTLTPLAERLVSPVDKILRDIDLVVTASLSFDPSRSKRRFTVALSDYTMLMLVPPVLRRVSAEAPAVTLEVWPLPLDQIGTVMKRSRVDLSIAGTARLSWFEGLKSKVLFTDRYVCAADQNHPELHDKVSLEDFQRLPHLGFTGRGEPFQYWPEVDITRRVDVVTESLVLAPFLLSGTRLLAVMQERLAQRFAAAAGIRAFEMPISLPPLELRVFWDPLQDVDPGNAWLRSIFIEVAQTL